MKKKISILILSLAVTWAVLFFNDNQKEKLVGLRQAEEQYSPQPVEDNNNTEAVAPTEQNIIPEFQPPLGRASERVTKKHFGILIDPKTSPVQPERFAGYHAGTDFEIFPEELDSDVTVRAVCSGKLRSKRYVNGYGGVVIQDCLLDNNPITVLYGHVKLSSIKNNSDDDLKVGDVIAILGAAYSSETSGERKHLHLSFHKGSSVNVLGYVQNKAFLSSWIDPCQHVCR